MRCASCGAARGRAESVCRFCGAEFSLLDRNRNTLCPACAARIPDRSRFCPRCAVPIVPVRSDGSPTGWACPACGPDRRLISRSLGELGAESEGRLPGASEVLPGLRITQNLSELARLGEQPPPRFRLLLGYAGWGPGQLLTEIRRNDWLVAPVDLDLVFAEGTESTWERGLRSVGVDPTTLPAWTAGENDGEVN